MKIIIDKILVEKALDALFYTHDSGISGEGWQSDELKMLIQNLKAASDISCNCHCSLPGIWHDQGCPMRY